ncbi:MAG: hypothetical protein QM727_00025 [Niabella sp.]
MPGDNFTPAHGNADSEEAIRFKGSLKESLLIIQTAKELGKIVPRPKLNITVTADITYKAIDPAVTIPKMVFSGLFIPARIKQLLIDNFVQVMEYPKIDLPMYEPLKNISKEYFCRTLIILAKIRFP